MPTIASRNDLVEDRVADEADAPPSETLERALRHVENDLSVTATALALVGIGKVLTEIRDRLDD
jgi:hypothetical protein